VLFIKLAAPKIPQGWQPYLTAYSSSASTASAA
jgi:hypothetical protein